MRWVVLVGSSTTAPILIFTPSSATSVSPPARPVSPPPKLFSAKVKVLLLASVIVSPETDAILK